LIATARHRFDRGLQTPAGANCSVRLASAEVVVITSTGVGFNECTRDSLQAAYLDGTLEPSVFKLSDFPSPGSCNV
jgi:ribulose-5-phosphate 4-epimerase/fuculose-1-phosphate aldolase